MSDGIASYVCLGLEVGDSGTPHIQGYVQFTTVHRRTSATKFAPRGHWEPQMATNEQARDYCIKDHKDEHFGTFTRTRGQSGARTDLASAVSTLVDADGDVREVALQHPIVYVKYHGGFRQLSFYHHKRIIRLPPKIYILWGPTGTGKSEAANLLVGEHGYWFPR